MILVDFSPVFHAAIHVDYAQNGQLSQEMIRHLIINQLRTINKNFGDKYGEIVLCLDSGMCWRKDIMPYYKFKRIKARAEDTKIDWPTIFSWINEIINEFNTYMPYKIVAVKHTEGDDIIAALTKYRTEQTKEKSVFHTAEKILIVSNDKDFKQLHKYPNVMQYYPMKNLTEHFNQPEDQLFELICRGDSTDGVPNIKSPEDIFTRNGERQKPITAQNIKSWKEKGIPKEYQERFNQNKQVIDLECIPEKIYNQIIEEYNKSPAGNKSKMFYYFQKYGLQKMLEYINDF